VVCNGSYFFFFALPENGTFHRFDISDSKTLEHVETRFKIAQLPELASAIPGVVWFHFMATTTQGLKLACSMALADYKFHDT